MGTRNLALTALIAFTLAACGGGDPAPVASEPVLAARAAPQLGTPPRAPDVDPNASYPMDEPASGLVVDTNDREAVRLFYRGAFAMAEGVAMGWTGSYDTGDAGTVAAAYQQATLLRVNWYRAMAGVPAALTFSDANSAKNQQAALMMSANGALSHSPPLTWQYYSAAGAEAAGRSSLCLSCPGPQAADAYMNDMGTTNGPVGHRRWLLYPQTRVSGSGSTPAGTMAGAPVMSANTMWSWDSFVNGPRPAVRDDFVAWPPRGYVPYPVVAGRWSISYPGADFTAAAVQVIRSGTSVPVSLEPVTNGFGENTLVWLLEETTSFTRMARPSGDDRYTVAVSNVKVNGVARSFSYDVIVFDPDTATPGAPQMQLFTPDTAVVAGVDLKLAGVQMPGASAYRIDSYRASSPALAVLESTAQVWTATTSGYNPFESTGVHLYNAAYAEQSITSAQTFLIQPGTRLEFDRVIGWASDAQKLRVQVGSGAVWTDVLVEAGAGAPVAMTGRSVDLTPFAGRLAEVRFKLDTPTGNYYYIPASGWTLSRIRVSGAVTVTPAESVLTALPGTVTVPSSGAWIFIATPQYKGLYFGESSLALTVQAASLTLSKTRSAYTISTSGSNFVVKDATGGAVAGTYPASALLQFSDVTVNLAVGGKAHSISGAGLRSLVELYIAYFNRVPDAQGLAYWIDQYRAGRSLDEIGSAFYAAGVAHSDVTPYRSTMTNTEFVTVVYKNVLGRDNPDPEGVAFWAGQLQSGNLTRGTLVLRVLASAHTFKDNPTYGWVASLLDNKYSVGFAFAVQQGLGYVDSTTAITRGIAIAGAVTPTSTGAALALLPVTDISFTLY